MILRGSVSQSYQASRHSHDLPLPSVAIHRRVREMPARSVYATLHYTLLPALPAPSPSPPTSPQLHLPHGLSYLSCPAVDRRD